MGVDVCVSVCVCVCDVCVCAHMGVKLDKKNEPGVDYVCVCACEQPQRIEKKEEAKRMRRRRGERVKRMKQVCVMSSAQQEGIGTHT